MELLDRGPQLAELHSALAEVSHDSGLLVLVAGEAGVGKSVFVQAFCASLEGRPRTLIGLCDSLSTPRPLAPVVDIAPQVGGELGSRLEAEDRNDVFDAFLQLLSQGSRRYLVVLEDAHWADEATLDLLRFTVRRLANTKSLLIVTYRDDEVGHDHPLRRALGDVATSKRMRRLQLQPFSEETVRSLALGAEVSGEELYARTGGNPFFVTETLAAQATGMPRSVRDAVLARAARLSRAGRAVLDAASVIGARIDPGLLLDLVEAGERGVDECLNGGLLRQRGRELAFRHELAREAIYDALSSVRKLALHRELLARLRGDPRSSLASLAHHAEAAGDASAVLHYAPLAARDAISVSAHRQAAGQLARALRFADGLAPDERAALLEEFAKESFLTDRGAEAIRKLQEAIALWRAVANPLREGAALAELAGYLVAMSENALAERASTGSIELLERLAPGPELAAAYSAQAGLRMLNRDSEEAVRWGEKAIALAEQHNVQDVLISALNKVGSALLVNGDETGTGYLERSLRLAQEAGLAGAIATAYSNLGSAVGERCQFERAVHYLEQGERYCREYDLDVSLHYTRAWLALSYLYLGRWQQAGETAGEVLRLKGITAISRVMSLIALGRLRARRGDPEVWPLLDEALEIAVASGTLQRLAPTHAARAEAAFLEGDLAGAAQEARSAYDLAQQHQHTWFTGELAYWRNIGGEAFSPPDWIARPYALQLEGDWQAASELWRELKCPYEAAIALANCPDESSQREALRALEELGARPAHSLVARRLRESGARAVPVGPRSSTRRNPAGLTDREMEVLGLLTEGLSNGAIGSRLHLSTKTVGHHVSSILGKLEVRNRTEAVSAGVRRGIVVPGAKGSVG